MANPPSLWISGLFNPMSFLTAIKQTTARAKGLALDDMVLKTKVLNILDHTEITDPAEDGAFIHGFFMEGARWECGRGDEEGYITDMVLKDLHPELPVMHVTAVQKEELTKVGYYECPVYRTTTRGATFVFCALLRMESDEGDLSTTWILSGTALLMAPE